MKIIYSLKERKPFVQALEEITGTKSVYKKPPTFAYEVGCLTITRDGDLEVDDHADVETMKQIVEELENRGFVAKENLFRKMQAEAPEEKEIFADDTSVECKETETDETQVKEDLGLTVSMPRKYFNDQALTNLKNLLESKQTLIETISNPQQSWGDSWTQGAINVVSN